jgi:hypothetical protein
MAVGAANFNGACQIVASFLKVTPRSTELDLGDHALAHTEHVGDYLLGVAASQHSTNGVDVCVGEFGSAVRRTVLVSSLADHVFRVVLGRAWAQVIRIAARWVVARVKDQLFCWNRAVRQLVGDAVCAHLSAALIADDAVSVPVTRAKPRPALVWCSGLVVAPKAFCERNSARGIAARPRAVGVPLAAHRSKFALTTEDCFHASIVAQMESVK